MECTNCLAQLSEREIKYLEEQEYKPKICFKCIRSLNGLDEKTA